MQITNQSKQAISISTYALTAIKKKAAAIAKITSKNSIQAKPINAPRHMKIATTFLPTWIKKYSAST